MGKPIGILGVVKEDEISGNKIWMGCAEAIVRDHLVPIHDLRLMVGGKIVFQGESEEWEIESYNTTSIVFQLRTGERTKMMSKDELFRLMPRILEGSSRSSNARGRILEADWQVRHGNGVSEKSSTPDDLSTAAKAEVPHIAADEATAKDGTADGVSEKSPSAGPNAFLSVLIGFFCALFLAVVG